MIPILAVILVAAPFAAAADLDTTSIDDVTTSKSTYDTTIQEYVKEYFKETGHSKPANANVSTSKVVPEHIKIYLHSSPEDVVNGTVVDYVEMLKYPLFNRSLETKVYIHGWLGEVDHKLHRGLSTLYALRGKRVNLISVDWSEYSFFYNFRYTKEQIVPKIAEYLVPMVEKIMEIQKNNRLHLIGFGMGAHMAGLIGKHIHEPKIVRITGLSPAGWFYNDATEEERLAKGDADYVDVIHTNMGGAGISKPIGDVDFLPNGGRYQPAIEGVSSTIGKVVGSHMLAQLYYVESVELGVGGFIGKKCESWTNFLNQKCALHEAEVMGEPVSRRVNGTVYMKVNTTMKYSEGIFGIYTYPYITPPFLTSTPMSHE